MENKEREIIKFDLVADYLPIVVEEYYDYNEDLYLGDKYDEFFDDNMNYKHNHPIWEDFVIVEEIVEDLELDRSWISYKVIVKRKSDNKYFKGFYEYSDREGYILDINPILEQVFPKEITKTIYE